MPELAQSQSIPSVPRGPHASGHPALRSFLRYWDNRAYAWGGIDFGGKQAELRLGWLSALAPRLTALPGLLCPGGGPEDADVLHSAQKAVCSGSQSMEAQVQAASGGVMH